ncbi:MAG: hypothetical protein AKCLJLPJ_01976 [Fimbriimonadales bacterium]|nr:hypothetical protein [Fimbriimonadales bacterium]MDL1927666.1 hypothetical protein [Fimbriimonadia bacterium ATM]NOG93778.1 hypothetical protein [Armatimonadota bacterium]
MPKLIGLCCALVALAGGIVAHVEPGTALLRAAIAFVAGSLLTQFWYVFLAARITSATELLQTTMDTEEAPSPEAEAEEKAA